MEYVSKRESELKTVTSFSFPLLGFIRTDEKKLSEKNLAFFRIGSSIAHGQGKGLQVCDRKTNRSRRMVRDFNVTIEPTNYVNSSL